MKDKEPPLADISPGGRALRAVKSKIKHVNSDLERRIDGATVARNVTFDPLRAAHDMPITDDNARNHEYVPRTVGPREFLSVL